MKVCESLPLNLLPLKTSARVIKVVSEFREVKHLADLGLTPGTEFTVLRRAALHGPLEILVRGGKLALGERIAKKIIVEPLVPVSI